MPGQITRFWHDPFNVGRRGGFVNDNGRRGARFDRFISYSVSLWATIHVASAMLHEHHAKKTSTFNFFFRSPRQVPSRVSEGVNVCV